MGYIKHNAIVCTTWKKEHIELAHSKAKEIFGEIGYKSLVSEIIEYIINEGYSFFIAPDGSKEGWNDSKECDYAREKFIDYLNESENYCDYVDVRFGGDDDHNSIEKAGR